MTLADLTRDLIWPELMRAPALALAPGRVVLATFLLVAVAALDQTWGLVFGGPTPGPLSSAIAGLGKPLGELLRAVFRDFNAAGAATAVYELVVSGPLSLVRNQAGGVAQNVAATVVLAPLAAVLFALVGGAVCRSAAVEYGQGRVMAWTQAVGYAAGRWSSLAGALLGPIAAVWLGCLALATAGWVMTHVPGMNIVGAVLFPVLVLLGLVVTVVMVAYVVGQAMLLPAVAADGADAFDAIQRAYAYVFGRPLRMLGYVVMLLVQGAIAVALVGGLALLMLTLLSKTTGVQMVTPDVGAGGTGGARIAEIATAGGAGGAGLSAGGVVGATGAAPGTGSAGTAGVAGGGWAVRTSEWLVKLWGSAVLAIVAGYGLSLYFTSSTLLYLAMRRLSDAQDMTDIHDGQGLEGAVALAPTRAKRTEGETDED